jgi:5-methylcytosine-specific restriction endonuclease McrA
MSTGFEKYPKLYGSKRWRHLRLVIFERDAYTCAMCQRVTPRPHCDHKTPHKGDVDLFFDEENLQVLCPRCHNSRKKMIEIHGYSQACGEDGLPLDSGHYWNQKKSENK